MRIADFEVGRKTFIIAELSANHGHDIEVAKKTIEAAKLSGADAIKLQTYTADTMTIDCDKEYFKLKQGTIWDGRTFYDLYKEAYTPWEWHSELKKHAENLGLIFFSTPFDNSAVDFLDELGVPVFKVASFELMDIPLIEYMASKGKPMIMSTGLASLSEIDEAVMACKRMGNNEIVLMKCTSSYPAKVEDANLITIPNMRETFGVEVGLSDHTIGITIPVLSVAMGVKVIEKHFIIDKMVGGPDASFSLEPDEFKRMVDSVREAEKALGSVNYSIEEKKESRLLGRSLFIVENVKKGELLTKKNVRSIRPGYGMAPKNISKVIGKKASRDIERGAPLEWSMIEYLGE